MDSLDFFPKLLRYHALSKIADDVKRDLLIFNTQFIFLFQYSAITIMLISANSYGISSLGSDNKYSLYGYLNKVFISFELGQLSSVAYPEFGVQVTTISIFFSFLK